MSIHESEVMDRVVRPIPEGLPIVSGSTPVVSFGNPHTAKVSTLGINPSHREFKSDSGILLESEKKRFTDRDLLGVCDHDPLSHEQGVQVIDSCYNYFSAFGNPYKNWFGRMDKYAVKPAGASYFDGTACHIDLVQWATDSIWSKIDEKSKSSLLNADVEFLRFQLNAYRFPLLLLNGISVINQFVALNISQLKEEIFFKMPAGSDPCRFFIGQYGQTKVLAWTNNIPQKTKQANLDAISMWIASQV